MKTIWVLPFFFFNRGETRMLQKAEYLFAEFVSWKSIDNDFSFFVSFSFCWGNGKTMIDYIDIKRVNL